MTNPSKIIFTNDGYINKIVQIGTYADGSPRCVWRFTDAILYPLAILFDFVWDQHYNSYPLDSIKQSLREVKQLHQKGKTLKL